MNDAEQLDICGVTVVPIMPGGKYCIVFEKQLSDEEIHNVQSTLRQWIESSEQFLVLYGGVKLVRVDEAEDAKSDKCC